MKTIAVRDLIVGKRLQYSIYESDGLLLLGRGMLLTETFVQGLLRRGIQAVSIRTDERAGPARPRRAGNSDSPARMPEVQAGEPRVGSDPATVGAGQGHPNRADQGPDSFSEARSPSEARTDSAASHRAQPAAASTARGWAGAEGGSAPGREPSGRAAGTSHADADSAAAPGLPWTRPYDARAVATMRQRFATAGEMVDRLAAAFVDGSIRETASIQHAAAQFAAAMVEDLGSSLAAIQTAQADRQLADRSVRMAVLGMAIGIGMGIRENDLPLLGTAALVHDWGLYRLSTELREPGEDASLELWRLYQQHPVVAFEMLSRIRDVPGTVALTALQVHEQIDGSGFPRGLPHHRIHPLARVLNLADAYLTITTPSPSQRGLYAADAMAYLMHHTCAGRFDNVAMQGLLRVMSVYPVGSWVQLSDQSRGQVLRATPEQFDRPIVQLLRPQSNGLDVDQLSDRVLDLRHEDLVIRKPLEPAESERQRLRTSQMSEVLWMPRPHF